MLDPKILRDTPELARKLCELRQIDIDIEEAHRLAVRRPEIVHELEELRHERNNVSDEVGRRKKNGEDAFDLIASMKTIGPSIKNLEQELTKVEEAFEGFLMRIPNMPHESVQPGGEEENLEISSWGEKSEYEFEPKPHWDLATELDILDLPRGSKISGSGFPLYKGLGARLERALLNYFLDLHTGEHGYTEWFTPFVAGRAAMTGTGQLPKFEEDMYHTDKEEDLFLIPTSEVTLASIHREEILEVKNLPLYYTGFSACFRREAGSAGKDTRGILRVHQFNKVEMVKYCVPETSWDEFDKMLANAETVLRNLGLHYRVIQLATADISFASAKTFDLEVWAPGVGKYLEVSSVSNCTDFQARRSGERFRDTDGKVRFVHTLNGSGLACPRIWIAIVENFQQADGSVIIPEVLRPYMGGIERITP